VLAVASDGLDSGSSGGVEGAVSILAPGARALSYEIEAV
jgi:hypothetical protein